MPDPFRDDLRRHHLALQAKLRDLPPGSLEWFDCERAISATARLYGRLYREAIDPIHSGPHPVRPSGEG